MSHLSILPTVLRDVRVLAEALEDLGLQAESGGELIGFADDRQAVSLRVQLPEGQWLGWRRQADGSLALVGDLQRLGRSRSLQQLIGRITRRYAARQALRTASQELAGADLVLAG
ncbi:MAG: DUF1257 domain-containing protein [Vulcanococcus sp.]